MIEKLKSGIELGGITIRQAAFILQMEGIVNYVPDDGEVINLLKL